MSQIVTKKPTIAMISKVNVAEAASVLTSVIRFDLRLIIKVLKQS